MFALALVLSVGGKIVAANRSLDGTWQAPDNSPMTAFLDRHGFRVGRNEDTVDSPFIRADAGDCRLLAVYAAPQGWHRDIVRQMASAQDEAFFVFRGAVYQDQPLWQTWTRHYWRLLNLYVGRRIPAWPVLGIVASRACDVHDMPWQDLAETP
jgi:hypothetical protein